MERTLPSEECCQTALFCTTGILLRKLHSPSYLSTVTHIVLDEVHERDVNSDFLLIILRNLIAQLPHVKVILMSATMNADTFSGYFNNCPTLSVEGFTHPVHRYYLEDFIGVAGFTASAQVASNIRKRKRHDGNKWRDRYGKSNRARREEAEVEKQMRRERMAERWPALTAAMVDDILLLDEAQDVEPEVVVQFILFLLDKYDDTPGAMLVFLPGWNTISKVPHIHPHYCILFAIISPLSKI